MSGPGFCPHPPSHKLEHHGGDSERISVVSGGMSKSFMPAIAEDFPKVVNAVDKFHVKQLLTTALDNVRKAKRQSSGEKTPLCRGRRLFMIPKARLSDDQHTAFSPLSKRRPQTGRACRILAALDDFYACQKPAEAETAFRHICSWMRRCRLQPMKDAADTLLRHRDDIFAYYMCRITNAICEGMNSMIQAAKEKARGFNMFHGFDSMICLITGRLHLAAPSPF